MIKNSRVRTLIIIGAGGLGREILWLAQECVPRWKILGFLDDAAQLQRKSVCGLPVLGSAADWSKYGNAHIVVAVGSPRARKDVVQRVCAAGAQKFATLIHPSVKKSRFVEVGAGTVVTAGCVLTTQVQIGQHVVVDRMVNVSHDCVIGDLTTVSPMVPIGGNVALGVGCWIGAGASIRQGIKVGEGSVVGMGAVVVNDVPPNQVVIGSPARFLRHLEPFRRD